MTHKSLCIRSITDLMYYTVKAKTWCSYKNITQPFLPVSTSKTKSNMADIIWSEANWNVDFKTMLANSFS